MVKSEKLDEHLRLVPRDFFRKNSPVGREVLSKLIDDGLISVKTVGCKVRKAEYLKDAPIPYFRTSDMGVMEVRPTIFSVSESVWEREKIQQDIRANDILVVKDGTYRIGEPIILQEDETKMVVQGHFYKFRVMDWQELNPYFLFWAMKKARQDILDMVFVQSTLSSITMDRIKEIMIPFPDKKKQNSIGKAMENILHKRRILRKQVNHIDINLL